MIEAPKITSFEAQDVAKIHLNVPCSEIQNVMGPGITEVFEAIAAQGLKPTGPWFSLHYKRPVTDFDFDICVPVSSPVKAVGRVQPGRVESTTVARTIYQGEYEGLRDAWEEFMQWMEKNEHKGGNYVFERYLAGPESGSDPSAWRTELNCPLIEHN